MAELRPYPFEALIRRAFGELEARGSVFDLPARKHVLGAGGVDLAVRFHGRRASCPLGPAAGPHTQMAQNIALSWLAGCRIFELKTVQIMDELTIPRPCIDMQTIGYNVEWSQELRIEQSIEEYVKASMLIDMLAHSGALELDDDFRDAVFDMSVGYDLAGVQSARVRMFIDAMRDASAVVERLREQIPREYAHLRDVPFRTKLSDTLTLSTFHGCPPDEIEQIIDFLLREVGLHCVVKLNPMLLGPEQARHLLNDVLGYRDVHIPDSAFERDIAWEQAVGVVERLRATAAARGLGLGVKLTNTLIVNNHRDFFPASESEMYLSGPPLHVLAVHLAGRFREHFGGALPISFSAGIDARNFADAVALGFVPITVCSDLLKPGGYGRTGAYFKNLRARMAKAGAASVGDFILRAYGQGEAALADLGLPADAGAACRAALHDGADLRAAAGDAYDAWVRAAAVRNTPLYVERCRDDPRYGQPANSKPPRRLDSHLALLDCITCDKCVPVCPNDANFTYALPQEPIPLVALLPRPGGFDAERRGELAVEQKHQIGNFADFCNECGNCDVFCPERGGPYVVKPRFFGTEADWRAFAGHDGFFLERKGGVDRALGRFEGKGYEVEVRGGEVRYSGDGFDLAFSAADPEGTARGEASGEVDLTYYRIIDALRRALLDSGDPSYVSALARIR